MNTACSICQGACCESVLLPMLRGDAGNWLALHGQPLGGVQVELPTPCHALDGCGRCGMYRDRPKICRDYKVGSAACIATVRRRRAGEQRDRILAALGVTE